MRLAELEQYNSITIQCHDNPDADALASGYGLYCYFKEKGKEVRLIYSGYNKVQKANLKLLIGELNLPLEHVALQPGKVMRVDGLLITVDCQYGAGNITRIEADEVAIVDHHQRENKNVALRRIQTNLGCCATLVWLMLKEADYPVNENAALSTALYYGLYMDTKLFSEIYNPLDMDMREELPYDKSLITRLCNSNLSLHELEIAGIAMIRCNYHSDHRFAVIKSEPCDPNILGLISDLLIQVDEIDACVVYNEINDGFKLSVRSCIREVNASELASYLTEGMGSGGGHLTKAGGFISCSQFDESYPCVPSEGYFNDRMTEYFAAFEIIDATQFSFDTEGMELYKRKPIPLAYMRADTLFPAGTLATFRTLSGDRELLIRANLYIVMGLHGELYFFDKREFQALYIETEESYSSRTTEPPEYIPTVKNREEGIQFSFADRAAVCLPARESMFYARPLENGVKVFTKWDENRYVTGRPGDYIVIRQEERQDISAVSPDEFARCYMHV